MSRSIEWGARLTCAVAVWVALGVLGAATASAEEKTLQNDGWVDNTAAGFQGGFVSGEIGASVFVPDPGDYPVRLQRVRLLFGGAAEGSTREVSIRIWQDTGSDSPGALLYDEQVEIQSSTQAFSEIDVSGGSIVINEGNFRVGIAFMHDGFPAIARDDDPGADFPDRNFIFAQGIGWVKSNLLGVNGDWIIRVIADVNGGGNPNNNPNNNTPDPDCVRNSDCADDEVCDNGVCVPDGCAEDRDCADNEICVVRTGECVPVECREDRDCDDDELCDTSSFECEPIDTGNNNPQPGGLSVASITPSSAPNDRDTQVSIVGAGFTADTSFRVGPTRLTNVLIQSDTAALATVPAGIAPGVYDVVVNRGAEQYAFAQGFIVEEADDNGSGGGRDDSCAISPRTPSSTLLLLLGALSLVRLLRRRSPPAP